MSEYNDVANFKVGEKIHTSYNKVSDNRGIDYVACGTIVSISVNYYAYLIEFDNETDGNTKPANIESYYKGFDFKDFKDGKSYWQINLKHIVSIKVKDTRLARKMYPDFKEAEDGYLMIMG